MRFRLGDLLATTGDSCSRRPPFLSDLVESPAVRLELGSLPAERLPALHCYINVLRVQLDGAADALSQFRCGERCSAAQEWLVDQLATLGVVQDRPRISSTGFCVGWSNFASSEPPMMNFGDGESQIVEFWPALPNQAAFFFLTYQHGSCWNQ